ncbi:MAG: N-acetyltransferase [Micrococcales bacterium]|nr:N-acetyltransferase [Micrococcales bacterium]
MEQPRVSVVNHPAASQFEMAVDGKSVGLLQYQLRPGVVALTHTEVTPRFGGRGLGSCLVHQALDWANQLGLKVLPFCPFVRDYIAAHPQFLELVAPERRMSFGLPR